MLSIAPCRLRKPRAVCAQVADCTAATPPDTTNDDSLQGVLPQIQPRRPAVVVQMARTGASVQRVPFSCLFTSGNYERWNGVTPLFVS